MVRTIDKATLTPATTSRLFGDAAGVSANFTPPTLMGPVTGVVNAVGLGVVANSTGSATANSVLIDAAVLLGKELYFPPNSDGTVAVYSIASTITLAQPGAGISSNQYGGWNGTGEVVLKAATGFTGPLVKFQPVSGDGGGLFVRNIKLDGGSLAGVTALVEYGNACYGDCSLLHVSGTNAPIGILTGSDIENILWDRVQMWIGIGIGVEHGANNRFVMADRCRFGGTTGALRVGADDAVSANRCQNITYDQCALTTMRDIRALGGTTPGAVVIARNVWNLMLDKCIVEYDGLIAGAITALVQLGTASAKPVNPTIAFGQLLGNNKASYGVEIVSAQNPVILSPQRSTMLTSDTVLNTQLLTGSPAGSGGYLWNVTVDDASGLNIAHGGTGTINTWKAGIKVEAAAGTVAFGALVTGDTVPRMQITTAGLAFGSGSASTDATLTRTANADLLGNKRIRGTDGLITNTGNTASRHAAPIAGQMYYDTTLGKPVWYDGANWVDATGATV